jgi:hypothetical protein
MAQPAAFITYLQWHETEKPALTDDAQGIFETLPWGDINSADDYEETIRLTVWETPLSVTVRSGWTVPGEPLEPDEFCLLLSWGGPACRITGNLTTHCEPAWQAGCRPEIQWQDWGTPWTELTSYAIDTNALLWFCEQFYYGE